MQKKKPVKARQKKLKDSKLKDYFELTVLVVKLVDAVRRFFM